MAMVTLSGLAAVEFTEDPSGPANSVVWHIVCARAASFLPPRCAARLARVARWQKKLLAATISTAWPFLTEEVLVFELRGNQNSERSAIGTLLNTYGPFHPFREGVVRVHFL